jgi:regulator of protease activity HflC (stomatin/prohibitin superfamily)
LSEDILRDVTEAAAGYGVAIRRADVKDLIFPGNLQEIMNRVLAAERNSEAQLVEARTRAEVARLEASTHAASLQQNAEAEAEARRIRERADAEAAALRAEVEAKVYSERKTAAAMLASHPALLRLEELQALRDLARNANARIYLGFGKNGLDVAEDHN